MVKTAVMCLATVSAELGGTEEICQTGIQLSTLACFMEGLNVRSGTCPLSCFEFCSRSEHGLTRHQYFALQYLHIGFTKALLSILYFCGLKMGGVKIHNGFAFLPDYIKIY